MAQTIDLLKGMNDLFEDELVHWRFCEDVFRRLCRDRGYGEIRTPYLEKTELFVRGLGEATAVVGKEMYTFSDKKGLLLSLRPEGTASVARAYLAGGLAVTEPFTRLYYFGPMFRYERPQKGRQRQFHQLGIEVFGLSAPASDCEVIALADAYWTELGLKGRVRLLLNSLGCEACRADYLVMLRSKLSAISSALCADCQERAALNPLRVFDCKNDHCRKSAAELPKISECLCEACQTHFDAVKSGLAQLQIAFELDPFLVRGLDYYSRTAFEWRAEGLGAQDAIGGGGRYDGLLPQLGGASKPAVGFAIGVERLVIALEAAGIAAPKDLPRIAILPLDEPAQVMALEIQRDLLNNSRFTVTVNLSGNSLKSQLRQAAKEQARYAVIIGEAERAADEVMLKDMQLNTQIRIPRHQVHLHVS